MSALFDIVAARIRAAGPITIAEYMDLALGHPEHGYYRRGAPIGAAGDFTTAPEISQIFGELIGLWLAQSWLDQGAPAPFALVELGPGRGTLMADLLRATRAAPGFQAAARLVLVERSGPLRAAQAAALAHAAPALTPEWLDDVAAAPAGPIFLVANEFLDALPVRQLRRGAEGWTERRVGLTPSGALAFEEDGALVAPAPDGADAPVGAWLEIGAEGEAVVGAVAGRIAAHGGAALFVDYGYTAAERADAGWPETLQALRAHAYADPLVAPGEADLTAHVDFDAMARAARAAGAAAFGPIGQGALLRALGAEARAAALAKAAPARTDDVSRAMHRLCHPAAMGRLFKALALAPPGAAPPAGFETAARTAPETRS